MGMTLADKISSIRIVLLPVFISLLIFSRTHPWAKTAAIVIFSLAVLSDFFDGLVARIKNEKSRLGMIIDPLADKLLMASSFLVLYVLRESLPLEYQMPQEAVLIVISRDVILALGLLVLYLSGRSTVITPTWLGKFTAFFQMATVFSLLVDLAMFQWLWKIAVVLTVLSGVDYFIRGVKQGNGRTKLDPV